MDSFIKHSALIWQQDGCTVDQARFSAGAAEQALKGMVRGARGLQETSGSTERIPISG
jgi:hypothetical protein